MHIFIATREGQGARNTDFFWTEEGEEVGWGMSCARDVNAADGTCKCSRILVGYHTRKGTTTFAVAEVDTPRDMWIARWIQSYRAYGVLELMGGVRKVRQEIERLLDIAAEASVGRVFERRGSILQPREARGATASSPRGG